MFDFKKGMDKMLDTGIGDKSDKSDKISEMMGFGGGSKKLGGFGGFGGFGESKGVEEPVKTKSKNNGKLKTVKIEIKYDEAEITPKDIKIILLDQEGVKKVK